MKTLASIQQEIPHIKESIVYYIRLCEKEIKNCDNKKKELHLAIAEAKFRLLAIEKKHENRTA